MSVIATAYVKLEVLSDRLSGDIRRAVQQSIRTNDREFDKIGHSAGQSVSKGLASELDKTPDVDDAARKMGTRTSKNITQGIDKNLSRDMRTAVRRGMASADRELDSASRRAGQQLERTFGKSVTQLERMAKLGGDAIHAAMFATRPVRNGAAGALAAALTSELIPAAAGLGAALASGAAIGGAAFGSLAASAGALYLGFQSDIQGLADLKKGFADLKTEAAKPIAEGMLPGMSEALENLRTVVRSVPEQLTAMGRAWGSVMSGMSATLARSDNVGRLKSILTDSAEATTTLGKAGSELTTSLLILGKAAQPLVRYFSEGALRMATWLRTTLEAKEANGELASSVSSMLERWKQFWATVKNFGSGIANVFRAAMPVADEMGASLLTISERFKAWTGDSANQARMTAFFQKMHELATPLVGLFGDIAQRIGLALEGMDIGPITRMIDKVRTDLVPAVAKLFSDLTTSTGPGFEETFNNLVDGFKQIVQDGTIPKVAGWIADLAEKVSSLVTSDAGSWLAGVALALAPFGGLGGAVSTLSTLGLALKGLSLLKLGSITTELSGLATALSSANITGAAAGLGTSVSTEVDSAVSGGIAGGATSGATKGAAGLGTLLKGVLKGSIILWIGGEILSAADADFKTEWDTLWKSVFDGVGGVAKTAAEEAGKGLAIVNWLISAATGNEEGKQRAADVLLKAVQDTFALSFEQLAQGWRDRFWAAFDTLPQNIKDMGATVGKMLTSLELDIPRDSPKPLLQLKKNLSEQLESIGDSILSGSDDLKPKVKTFTEDLNRILDENPTGPLHKMATDLLEELNGLTSGIDASGYSLGDSVGRLKGFLSSPLLGSNFSTDPFKDAKTSIKNSLQGVIDEIESGGPNLQGKLDEFFKALEAAPPDMPGFEDLKKNLVQTLKEAGVDIPAALSETAGKVDAGTGSFADVIGSALQQARQNTATKLGQLFATFQITEMPSLSPLAQSIRDDLNDVAQAFATGSPDLQTKVDTLLAVLNTVPADSPLAGLRSDILEQLKGMGVDVSAYAPILGEAGGTLGKAWGKSIPGAFGQGLAEGKPGALGELSIFGSDVVGKLGIELPGLILGTKPAIGSAVGSALTDVPGIGILPFLSLNAQAGGIAGQLGSAITPGLLGATGSVGSGLSGVPSTGSAPFNVLGQALLGIVGGFAGLIAPGLFSAGQQPGNAWSGVPSAGQAPWTTMAQSVVRTLTLLATDVSVIMMAIAATVRNTWGSVATMNAGGIGNLMATAQAAIAMAVSTRGAADTVQENARRIAEYIPAITAAVLLSERSLESVRVQATAAAIAASQAASAAVAAAQARASTGGGLVAMAAGGVVTSPMIALIGEAGPERVEPLDSQGLSDRDRAIIREIVASMATGAQSASVELSIRPGPLNELVDARIVEGERRLARRIQYARPY